MSTDLTITNCLQRYILNHTQSINCDVGIQGLDYYGTRLCMQLFDGQKSNITT